MKEILIRPANKDDVAYITATWIRNYKKGSLFAKKIKNSVYYAHHNKIIQAILSRESTHVAIASLETDPEVIFGYLVYEQKRADLVIHFAFVKEELRRLGIAKLMFQDAKIDPNQCLFTHRTFEVEPILSKYPGLTYDPYNL